MSHVAAEARPLSCVQIRQAATTARRFFGLEKNPYVDVAKLIEFDLPSYLHDFHFDVKDRVEMGNKHGEANPAEKLVIFREDVWEGILGGRGRDRLTAIHELGHLILHTPERITLTRSAGKPKPFKDPEWQANCFAGEFLASHLFARADHTPEQFARLAGVSVEAATIQLNRYRREGLMN